MIHNNYNIIKFFIKLYLTDYKSDAFLKIKFYQYNFKKIFIF